MDLSKGFKYLADSSYNLVTSFKSLGLAMPAIQDVLGSSISRGFGGFWSGYRASNGDAADPRVDRNAAEQENWRRN